MGFLKLLLAAFIWLMWTLWTYIAPFHNPDVPSWVMSIGAAVLLCGFIAHKE